MKATVVDEFEYCYERRVASFQRSYFVSEFVTQLNSLISFVDNTIIGEIILLGYAGCCNCCSIAFNSVAIALFRILVLEGTNDDTKIRQPDVCTFFSC